MKYGILKICIIQSVVYSQNDNSTIQVDSFRSIYNSIVGIYFENHYVCSGLLYNTNMVLAVDSCGIGGIRDYRIRLPVEAKDTHNAWVKVKTVLYSKQSYSQYGDFEKYLNVLVLKRSISHVHPIKLDHDGYSFRASMPSLLFYWETSSIWDPLNPYYKVKFNDTSLLEMSQHEKILDRINPLTEFMAGNKQNKTLSSYLAQGSPLLALDSDGKWIVLGLLTIKDDYFIKQGHAFFARIYSFARWIDSIHQ